MIPSLIRIVRQAVGLVGVALLAVLVAFSLFIHIVPLTGHQLFIVGGGSMEPSIPIGSVVVVGTKDPLTVSLGDIITIRADDGVVITHRVTRLVDLPDGRLFELTGDANKSPDGSLVPARAMVGAVQGDVPYAGYLQDFLSSGSGAVATLAALGALFFAYLLLEMVERSAVATPSPIQGPIGP
jgi:signal peptidase I